MNYTSCAQRQQGNLPYSVEEYLFNLDAVDNLATRISPSYLDDDFSDLCDEELDAIRRLDDEVSEPDHDNLSEEDFEALRPLHDEDVFDNFVPEAAVQIQAQPVAASGVADHQPDDRPVAKPRHTSRTKTRIKINDRTRIFPDPEPAVEDDRRKKRERPANDNISWREADRVQKFHGAVARAHELGGYAFTLKLSNERIERIRNAVSHGEYPVRVISKELDRYLRQVFPDGLLPYAFAFEGGPGIPLHLHGVLVLPGEGTDTLKRVKEALGRAGGRLQKFAACRQTHTKKLYDGSGWFRYSCKTRRATADVLGCDRLTFVSQRLTQSTHDGWDRSPASRRSASKVGPCRKRRTLGASSTAATASAGVPVAQSAAPSFHDQTLVLVPNQPPMSSS